MDQRVSSVAELRTVPLNTLLLKWLTVSQNSKCHRKQIPPLNIDLCDNGVFVELDIWADILNVLNLTHPNFVFDHEGELIFDYI